MRCKFDRVNPRPLSFIISAFDQFFGELLNKGVTQLDRRTNDAKEIRAQILKSFSSENMSTLCHLIPNVRIFMAEELSSQSSLSGGHSDSIDTEASKCRLHHLFGVLIDAISQKPVILFLDDIHWADQGSLELMIALMHGVGRSGGSSQVLFIGSYRSNEVAESDPLGIALKQIKSLSNVTLTEIPLNGLSCDNVNEMISEALCYPRRLTLPLAKLIHEKSTGNPLFVKEFLSEMAVENMLNYR